MVPWLGDASKVHSHRKRKWNAHVQEGQDGESGNHLLLSCNLVPGKIVVQVLMKASFRHLWDRKVTHPAGLYLVIVPDIDCLL